MAMIVIQGPNGQRKVPELSQFRLGPGERVIGSESNLAAQSQWGELQKAASNQGIPWGDMIAAATKAFGIKPCSSCEQRRQILNNVSEIGISKAVQLIKKTFYNGNP